MVVFVIVFLSAVEPNMYYVFKIFFITQYQTSEAVVCVRPAMALVSSLYMQTVVGPANCSCRELDTDFGKMAILFGFMCC